jgi:hypothetical protein
MADAAKEKGAGRGGLNPLVIEGAIKKELLQQARFAETWGELIPDRELPRNTEEAIAIAKAKLAKAKAGLGGAEPPTYQTAFAIHDEAARAVVSGKDPEGDLKKAFKVMKGGV